MIFNYQQLRGNYNTKICEIAFALIDIQTHQPQEDDIANQQDSNPI